MSSRSWSQQQETIFARFRNVERQRKHIVIRARAGTGKTTTILEAITHAPETSILLCAFNKRIEQELTSRLRNPNAVAKTLHSVGFGLVRRNWTGVRVDAGRSYRVAARAWAQACGGSVDSAPDPVITVVMKLVGLGKNMAPFGPEEALVDLAIAHNAVVENGWAEEYPVERLAAIAWRAMGLASQRDGAVDFDDMVWLPVVHKWGRPTYSLLIVDEAQDMNATQLLLARSVASGRIVVVGDDKQAIYGFRGADAGALDRMKEELDAEELPLTTTYRCPRAIVEAAQALVPDFNAAPSAPAGLVASITEATMMEAVAPADFVLSRKNAPLGRLCLALLRAGKRARIEGRDIAKGIIALVRRQKTEHIPVLLERLEIWKDRELAKLARSKSPGVEARMDYVVDQVETVAAVSDGLADVAELIARIDELFAEQRGPSIVLSSVHRAKGLEADRVFVLADTLYCGGKRHTDEERNIHYVALTRSRAELYLVSTPKDAPEKGGAQA